MTLKLVWMNYVGIDLVETIFFINIIAQLEADRDLKLVSYSTRGNSSQLKRISRNSQKFSAPNSEVPRSSRSELISEIERHSG